MRVLVCGGRCYADYARMAEVLDKLHREHTITTIIHGGAAGADAMAGMWAWKNGVPVEAYPPDWERYGIKAGPQRNQEMLVVGKPELVVCAPGGKGTADMKRRAMIVLGSVLEIVDAEAA